MTVLVLGSLNVDHVAEAPALPGPGETVLGSAYRSTFGGKGANQAVAAARLGAPTWILGCVGDDEPGQRYLDVLAAEGVTTDLVARSSLPTGAALILVGGDGENCIVVAPGANGELAARHVDNATELLARGPGVLVASLEVPMAAVERGTELARAHGWRVVLNPAPAQRLPEGLLQSGDVVTPNEHEAHQLHPDGIDGLTALGCSVLVTLGRAGARLLQRGAEPVDLPAPTVDAVDTTGAGDACTGALAWALDAGLPLEEAARRAVTAASLSTRARGAQAGLVSSAELEAAR